MLNRCAFIKVVLTLMTLNDIQYEYFTLKYERLSNHYPLLWFLSEHLLIVFELLIWVYALSFRLDLKISELYLLYSFQNSVEIFIGSSPSLIISLFTTPPPRLTSKKRTGKEGSSEGDSQLFYKFINNICIYSWFIAWEFLFILLLCFFNNFCFVWK